jgi:hypothetical protein
MSPTRIIAVIAVAGALAVAAASGGTTGSGSEPDTAATLDTTPTTATTTTPAPTSTPTSAATKTPKPRPSPTPSSGDGDADEGTAPSTAGGGVCRHLSAEQVGAILGTPVRGAAVSGETGCTFEQGGKRGTSVTVLDRSTARAGGMDGAKNEATSAVEGEPQDVPGIGAAAFVVTGSMFGEPDVQGAGAVQVGARIISVFLEQRSGIAAAKVRNLEIDLLRLVAHAAG